MSLELFPEPTRPISDADRLVDGDLISDAELTAEAMAADPDPSLEGTRPLHELSMNVHASTLPSWYMPAVMSGGRRLRGWRRATVFTFIAALVVIEAFGLCSTYGQFI